MDLKEIWYGLNSNGSGYGPTAGWNQPLKKTWLNEQLLASIRKLCAKNAYLGQKKYVVMCVYGPKETDQMLFYHKLPVLYHYSADLENVQKRPFQ